MGKQLTATVSVNKPIETVWKAWVDPEAIRQWNRPFDNWSCPRVENDVRDGGQFDFRMEAEDGTDGFNYKGSYRKVIPFELIEIDEADGRQTKIEFFQMNGSIQILETFEAEAATPVEVQKQFCQSVLNRFKQYVEK